MPGTQPGFDPQGGDRVFVKTAPLGAAVERDLSTWSHLAGRTTPLLNEKFVRELPLEYREMLCAYYEALASQER
jgi:hypothetical protein